MFHWHCNLLNLSTSSPPLIRHVACSLELLRHASLLAAYLLWTEKENTTRMHGFCNAFQRTRLSSDLSHLGQSTHGTCRVASRDPPCQQRALRASRDGLKLYRARRHHRGDVTKADVAADVVVDVVTVAGYPP